MQHYVPNLALEVTKHNEDSANAEKQINLQGFLVGEKALAYPWDCSFLPIWRLHSSIP